MPLRHGGAPVEALWERTRSPAPPILQCTRFQHPALTKRQGQGQLSRLNWRYRYSPSAPPPPPDRSALPRARAHAGSAGEALKHSWARTSTLLAPGPPYLISAVSSRAAALTRSRRDCSGFTEHISRCNSTRCRSAGRAAAGRRRWRHLCSSLKRQLRAEWPTSRASLATPQYGALCPTAAKAGSTPQKPQRCIWKFSKACMTAASLSSAFAAAAALTNCPLPCAAGGR